MSDPSINDANTATFLFEVDGVDIGWFMEVSGLEVSIETEDVNEGGQNSFVHKLPGRMTWPNITLKRGVTKTNSLLDWLNESSGETFTANGNRVTRKTAAITLLDRTGTGPSFAASSAEAPTEELEITHHGFRVREL